MNSPGRKRVRQVHAARPVVSDRWKGWVALATLAVMVIVGLAFIAGGPIQIAYDQSHLGLMECAVTSAKPNGDRYGARSVVIETSDCGKLALTDGVTDSNMNTLATQIDVGGRFTFEIGASTLSMLDFYHAINITPEVYSFRKL